MLGGRLCKAHDYLCCTSENNTECKQIERKKCPPTESSDFLVKGRKGCEDEGLRAVPLPALQRRPEGPRETQAAGKLRDKVFRCPPTTGGRVLRGSATLPHPSIAHLESTDKAHSVSN